MPRPAFVYHPAYEIDIGAHVFPTQKFRLMREQLLAQGLCREEEIEEPPKATDEELLLVLEESYLRDLRRYRHSASTMRSELPITEEIIEGVACTAGGTIHCVRRALENGVGAIHIGGGFHHGYPDHAEGFCYINDVAIGAAWALERGGAKRVSVIDLDVHQGNGTAACFADDRRVFTLSIHEEHLYPFPKEPGSLDAGLEARIGDAGYLEVLQRVLPRAVEDFRPDLAIYVAGVDPYEEDRLGGLGLSWGGMRERDRLVLEALVGGGIPFVTVVAGGYAMEVSDTVGLHVQTVRVALQALDPKE